MQGFRKILIAVAKNRTNEQYRYKTIAIFVIQLFPRLFAKA